MKKAELNSKNIRAYILGNIRYFLYYSFRLKFLIRGNISEQIDWRISIMERKCYEEGSCQKCGCNTTHLQMANKSCDKPCYPPIMSKKLWQDFILGKKVEIKGDIWSINTVNSFKFKRHKIIKNGVLVHVKYIDK